MVIVCVLSEQKIDNNGLTLKISKMKKPIIFIVVMIAFAFSSCNCKEKADKETLNESYFDIAKMVEDFENYDCREWPNCDTFSFFKNVDLLMDYCRRPNIKLAPMWSIFSIQSANIRGYLSTSLSRLRTN